MDKVFKYSLNNKNSSVSYKFESFILKLESVRELESLKFQTFDR